MQSSVIGMYFQAQCLLWLSCRWTPHVLEHQLFSSLQEVYSGFPSLQVWISVIANPMVGGSLRIPWKCLSEVSMKPSERQGGLMWPPQHLRALQVLGFCRGSWNRTILILRARYTLLRDCCQEGSRWCLGQHYGLCEIQCWTPLVLKLLPRIKLVICCNCVLNQEYLTGGGILYWGGGVCSAFCRITTSLSAHWSWVYLMVSPASFSELAVHNYLVDRIWLQDIHMPFYCYIKYQSLQVFRFIFHFLCPC